MAAIPVGAAAEAGAADAGAVDAGVGCELEPLSLLPFAAFMATATEAAVFAADTAVGPVIPFISAARIAVMAMAKPIRKN